MADGDPGRELGLEAEQPDRYSRHGIMDGVGPAGGAALLDGSALVVGAGGLGSPAVQYLGAAGVGTLEIVDDDTVERSNLQRQVIHADADIGRPKVESAREFVTGLNPDVDVRTRECRVGADNVEALVSGHDVVVDATDNFEARFLLNDACALAGIPFSQGAVYRFEGQTGTFAGGSPCYRCLFPEAPPPGTVPDCATAGVLGVLPGVIGAIQATEAIKTLLEVGDTLAGRLLTYDARSLTFEGIRLRPDPDCPVCGETPRIDSVSGAEYDDRCAL